MIGKIEKDEKKERIENVTWWPLATSAMIKDLCFLCYLTRVRDVPET